MEAFNPDSLNVASSPEQQRLNTSSKELSRKFHIIDKGVQGKVKNVKISKNQIDNVIDDRGSDLSCNE